MTPDGAQNGCRTSDAVGLALLEKGCTKAATFADLRLDPLVFDSDVSRRGQFDGFFLARDAGAENYVAPKAPEANEWARRYNGPGRVIPGIHLPKNTQCGIVAAGPLMKIAKPGQPPQPRFEAVVICDQVIDRKTACSALQLTECPP